MMPIGKALVLGGVAASLIGCSDEPTAAGRPTITLPAEQVAALNGALEDALTRLVPALADQTAAQDVRRALASSSLGLAALDAARLDGGLSDVGAALSRYRVSDNDRPIVESIRLVIGQVNAQARRKP